MKILDIKAKTTSVFQSVCGAIFDIFSTAVIMAFVFEYVKPGFFSNWIDLSRVCLFIIIIGVCASLGPSFKKDISVWKKTWKIGVWTLLLLCLSMLIYNRIDMVSPYDTIIFGTMCLLSISIPVVAYR